MPLKQLILVDIVNASSPSSSAKRSSLVGLDFTTLGLRSPSKVPPAIVTPRASFVPSAVKTAPGTPSRIPVRPKCSNYVKTAAPLPPMTVRSGSRSPLRAPVENIVSPKNVPITTAISRGLKRLWGRGESGSTCRVAAASDVEISGDMRSSSPASSATVVADDVPTLSSPRTTTEHQEAIDAISGCTASTLAESFIVGEDNNGASSKPHYITKVSGPSPAGHNVSQLNRDTLKSCAPVVAEDHNSYASRQVDDDSQDLEGLEDILSSFPLPPGAVRSIAPTVDSVAPLRHAATSHLPIPTTSVNGCTVDASVQSPSKTITGSLKPVDENASRPRTVGTIDIHPRKEDDDFLYVDLVADMHRQLNPVTHHFPYALVSLSTAAESPEITHREEDFEEFERRMQASYNPLPISVAHTFGNTTISLGEALELRKAAKARGESGGLNSLITPAHFRAGRRPPTKEFTSSSQNTSSLPAERNVKKRVSRGCSAGASERRLHRLRTVQEEEENEASSTNGINVLAESPLSRIIASVNNDPNASAHIQTARPILRRSAATSHLTSNRTINLPCLTPYTGEIDLIPRQRRSTTKRTSRDSAIGVLVPSSRHNSDVAWWTDRGSLAIKEIVAIKSTQPMRAHRTSLGDKENVAPLKRQSRVERRNGRIF
ncbi:hypothetical protein BD410DRAFT_828431 [Rickenella mellea]|uniref:Uncharacterized protein n=1 Tax=Rickenella mellea TaxID=50990 RepID=A0A4Y7Q3T4_9AGAM|nr:hypothetical protein BD410DRAFT_828431 [Rickenella mellea]